MQYARNFTMVILRTSFEWTTQICPSFLLPTRIVSPNPPASTWKADAGMLVNYMNM